MASGSDSDGHGYVSMLLSDGIPFFINCFSPKMLSLGVSVLVCHT